MYQNNGQLFQKLNKQNPSIMVRSKNKKNDDNELFIIECIVDRRRVDGKLQYLVKWKDYPSSHNTWEDAANIAHCREIVQEFKEHRFQEGYDDSEDDSPIPPPPIIPPRRKRSRKRKSDDNNQQQQETSDIYNNDRKNHEIIKNEEEKIPKHTVNLSSAIEVIGASYYNQNKFFCVLFNDGSKYWVSNEECRKHLPQMLLDFYEQCSVFTDNKKNNITKTSTNSLSIKRRNTTQLNNSSGISKAIHYQSKLFDNDSMKPIDEQHKGSFNENDKDLILEESTTMQDVNSYLLSPNTDNDFFSNNDFIVS